MSLPIRPPKSRNAGRLAKIGHLAECLRRLEPEEIPVAVAYLCGELPQGRIGIGWSMLKDALTNSASGSPALTLADTDASFETMRNTSAPNRRTPSRPCARFVLQA